MNLDYLKYDFCIEFARPVTFDTYPLFIIRSILGNELRKISCLSKDNNCENCIFNLSCAYSWIFETILDKGNSSLPGRTRGSHPWSLQLINIDELHFSFTLTLIGKAIEYFPNIYAALKSGESKGVNKERIPYKIVDIICKGTSIFSKNNDDGKKINPETFILNQDCKTLSYHSYKIDLFSPLRITKGGKICKHLEPDLFFPCINRRIRTAISLYGDSSDNKEYSFSNIQFKKTKLIYQEMQRWSSRQKKVQKLGGIKGSFVLSGNISKFEESLLEGAVLFGAGKLNNFGLGQIKIEEN